jgi:hypothetical protein
MGACTVPGCSCQRSAADEDEAGDDIDDDSADMVPLAHRPGGVLGPALPAGHMPGVGGGAAPYTTGPLRLKPESSDVAE